MAISPAGDRNWAAAVRRVTDSAWWGRANGAAKAPLALNNETIDAVNAAGTGVVGLIKADASDVVTLPAGVSVPAGQVLTLGGVLSDSAGINRLIPNVTAKTIVDGSATALFDVACASGEKIGGVFFYQVVASDGTDHQSMAGMVSYSAVSKAGTHTLAITNATANDAKAVSTGTLTLAFTNVTGTGKVTIKLQPTGSLTETLYTITYTVFPIAGAVTIV